MQGSRAARSDRGWTEAHPDRCLAVVAAVIEAANTGKVVNAVDVDVLIDQPG